MFRVPYFETTPYAVLFKECGKHKPHHPPRVTIDVFKEK